MITVGALLRFYNLEGTLIFLGDQGRDALIVRHLLVDWDPILVGPTTSVGKIQLGPLYYYFMAPWLLGFGFNPLGPAVGVAALGVLTIGVMFYVTHRMLGKVEAVTATTLYVFSVVVIDNTRFSWNPNPMPLIVLLLLGSLYEVASHRRWVYLAWSWVWLGVALQLHYMMLLVTPFVGGVWGWIGWQSKDRWVYLRYMLYGAGAFLLLLLPLVLFDLRHNYLNLQGFWEFFYKGHHSPQLWYQPVLDMEGRLYQMLGQVLGLEPWPAWRKLASWLLLLLVLGAWWRNKTSKGLLLILAYAGVSWGGLAVYRGDVFVHYLGFVYPLVFLFAGAGLAMVWRQAVWGKLLSSLVVLACIGVNVSQYTIHRSLGWQVADVQAVAKVISRDVQAQPYNILALDDTKDYRAMNYRYFLEVEGTPPLDVSDYTTPSIIYIISQDPIQSLIEIETRELEAFLGQSVMGVPQTEEPQRMIAKITQDWKFDGGPWVYRVEENTE